MRVDGLNSVVMPHFVQTEKQKRVNSYLQNQPEDKVSFKGFATSECYSRLMDKGVYYCYNNLPSESVREFASKCVWQTVEVMESLFGRGSLPKKITFAPLKGGVLGQYDNYEREVTYNSDASCFHSMRNLSLLGLSNINIIAAHLRGNEAATIHPAHVFIHELAHSAHWEHLVSRNGEEHAEKIWAGLANSPIPNLLGRYVARMGLGSYAVDSKDMCEFVAETIAQDVCNAMPLASTISFTDTDVWTWKVKKPFNADYDTVFDRNHNYRYAGPRAYFDYFMQQTWRGDIDSADVKASDLEGYLADTDASRVPDSVQSVNGALKKGAGAISDAIIIAGGSISEKVEGLRDSLGKGNPIVEDLVDSAKETVEETVKETVGTIMNAADTVTKKTSEIFGKITSGLDGLNKIKIKKPW